MARVTVTRRGAGNVSYQIDVIKSRLGRFISMFNTVTPETIEAALRPIYEQSQELVPVKTGRLKESGYIEAEETTKGASGHVGYARGDDPPYAIYVHEDLEAKHEPPTQAKFLEQPVNEQMDQIPRRLRREYMRHILAWRK